MSDDSARRSAITAKVYSREEKLKMALTSLRQRIAPKRHLIAGPYAGEFGYELMQWQGFLRARRPHYEQAHVITYPGRAYLYEGFSVHPHDVELRTAGYGYGLQTPERATELASAKARDLGLGDDWDHFHAGLLCTRYHKTLFWHQDFRLLREPPLSGGISDVAFHFRAVKKEGPDQMKNYSSERCEALVTLCRDAGFTVSCIGHPAYSICPPGAVDHRSVDLQSSVAAISSARLVSGENSGPMHLANLCGKPTLLWAQDQWRIDYSLRWNPFRVPIFTAANDTCQPEPERVLTALRSALAELRALTADFSRDCHTFPARPISPV